MARLKTLLYPGETILLREERSVGQIAMRLFARFAVAGGLFLALYNSIEQIGRWLDGMVGFTGVLTGLVLIFLVVVGLGGLSLLSIFLEWLAKLRPDYWRIAVTDQRVLVRRGLLGRGHDEMMRYDVATGLYDRARGKIVITGAGRELAIVCNRRQAGRILKALGRDEVIVYPRGGAVEPLTTSRTSTLVRWRTGWPSMRLTR